MTLQCAYGTEPKTGAPAFFVYDDTDIANSLTGATGFFTAFALGLPRAPIETAVFCSTEPDLDLPTTADYLKLSNPPLALLSGTYQRFKNQVIMDKWAAMCYCSGDPVGPCTGTSELSAGSQTTLPADLDTDITVFSAVDGTLRLDVNNVSTTAMYWRIKAVKSGQADAFPTGTVGAAPNYRYIGPNLEDQPNLGTTFAGHAWSYYDSLHFQAVKNGGWTGTMSWEHVVDWTGACPPEELVVPDVAAPPEDFPDAPGAAICTTEQDICDALNVISNKLDWMRSMVDLTQRRLAPFAWITGAVHSGLTGSGSFDVWDILGLAVSVTTVPTSWGRTAETPERLIPSVGSIQAVDDGLYSENRQVHYASEVLELGAPWATSVRYNFRPGVVATVTELKPEP